MNLNVSFISASKLMKTSFVIAAETSAWFLRVAGSCACGHHRARWEKSIVGDHKQYVTAQFWMSLVISGGK